MKLRSKKGFSLVELIIVIAIMGIIAVIAIPNLTGIQQRSQVNADIRTAETIARAVATCVAEERTGSNGVAVNNKLAGGWVKLDSLETTLNIDMDEYVETTLKPKSAKSGSNDGAYFVKLVTGKNNLPARVVVAIAKGAETLAAPESKNISGVPYDASFAGDGITSMIACINGLELNATNCANYNN